MGYLYFFNCNPLLSRGYVLTCCFVWIVCLFPTPFSSCCFRYHSFVQGLIYGSADAYHSGHCWHLRDVPVRVIQGRFLRSYCLAYREIHKPGENYCAAMGEGWMSLCGDMNRPFSPSQLLQNFAAVIVFIVAKLWPSQDKNCGRTF